MGRSVRNDEEFSQSGCEICRIVPTFLCNQSSASDLVEKRFLSGCIRCTVETMVYLQYSLFFCRVWADPADVAAICRGRFSRIDEL